MNVTQPARRRRFLARLRDHRDRRRRDRERTQQRIDAAIDAARLRTYRGDLEDRHTGWRPR